MPPGARYLYPRHSLRSCLLSCHPPAVGLPPAGQSLTPRRAGSIQVSNIGVSMVTQNALKARGIESVFPIQVRPRPSSGIPAHFPVKSRPSALPSRAALADDALRLARLL